MTTDEIKKMASTQENFKLYDTIATLPGGMDLLINADFAFAKLNEGRAISVDLIKSFVTDDRDARNTIALMMELENLIESIPEVKT